MDTAAAAAPEAPAIRTVFVLVVVAATPKIKPKMETVPSSIPKTIVPAELANEIRRRCKIEPIFILVTPNREVPATRLSKQPWHDACRMLKQQPHEALDHLIGRDAIDMGADVDRGDNGAVVALHGHSNRAKMRFGLAIDQRIAAVAIRCDSGKQALRIVHRLRRQGLTLHRT